jgi:hypothetical protein
MRCGEAWQRSPNGAERRRRKAREAGTCEAPNQARKARVGPAAEARRRGQSRAAERRARTRISERRTTRSGQRVAGSGAGRGERDGQARRTGKRCGAVFYACGTKQAPCRALRPPTVSRETWRCVATFHVKRSLPHHAPSAACPTSTRARSDHSRSTGGARGATSLRARGDHSSTTGRSPQSNVALSSGRPSRTPPVGARGATARRTKPSRDRRPSRLAHGPDRHTGGSPDTFWLAQSSVEALAVNIAIRADYPSGREFTAILGHGEPSIEADSIGHAICSHRLILMSKRAA